MEKSFFGLVALLLLAFAAFIADGILTEPINFPATVIDRAFTPSQTSTGVGYGTTSNGKMGTVVTTQTTEEKWNVVIQSESGIMSATTSPQRWSELKPGDKITAQHHIGKLFHILWETTVL